MKIIFHGAAKEVGKSCIELVSNGRRYLLDAGVKFIHRGVEYPKFLDKIFNIDALFLSHAHMDHCGAIPMLEHKNLNCNIFCNKMTWDISNLLLEDGYNLERLRNIHIAYTQRDIFKAEKHVKLIKCDKEYTTRDKKITFCYMNSGHIPGSCSILLNVEDKKVLYSADINTEETSLMMPSEIDKLRDIDILISECTYGDRYHPDFNQTKQDFLLAIEKTILRGGSVLLPCFGVGRTQEILILLRRLSVSCPIYIDGMGKKICELVIKDEDKYIRNLETLKDMYNRCIKADPHRREQIAKQKGIIILTTSGMMQGGPVMSYAPHMIQNELNEIIFSGYQANATNGRSILEDRTFYFKGQRVKVLCKVKKFDFSAHLGRDSLKKMVEKVKPKYLILNHGDLSAIESFKQWVEENQKEVKVIAPNIGEELNF